MAGRSKEKMAPTSNERTPLITTVHVGPPRQRYRHNTLRRFCFIGCLSTLIAASLLLLLPVGLLFPHRHRQHHRPPPPSAPEVTLSFEELKAILLETPKEDKAQEWSKYYTSGPHLAGANFSQALWTQEKWTEFGIKADIVAYDTYLNYPVDHRLALFEKNKTKGASDSELETWKVKFEASLVEDVLEEDPTSGLENRIPTFHGYSASGNVTAPYVFVNYGTYKDFEDLVNANISLAGKIAIAKYGGIFRGLKIKRAEDLGMVGAILYSDPGDDGPATDENGVDLYPNGPARQPSSVQRGSAQYLSISPGDPTTPGYPSKPGVPRAPIEGRIPSIPSIPISYVDAIPILTALNGHGPSAKDFNKYWEKNQGLKYKGVDYNIGPSPDHLVLNLLNEQNYVTTPMWDVIGIINGTLKDEIVVIGNHRDAWVAGGAGDPNSGSAALNEVIRSFGVALSKGYKPLRTIVFASWDGEEYGLVGSTEWVEEYLPWLSGAAVAYVNVDVATTGPIFSASASPTLNKILFDSAALVQSPNQTIKGQTIADLWDKKISTLGSGSDYTAFLEHAGVPSLDMGFGADPNTKGGPAVYHYHSNYDSYYWMNTFGDPGFHYHIAITKLWAIVTAQLAEAPVIPLNATDYALAIQGYIRKVESTLDGIIAGVTTEQEDEEARSRPTVMSTESRGDPHALKLSFGHLHHAAKKLIGASKTHDAWAADLAAEAGHDIPWWKWISKLKLFYYIRAVNSKYKYLERQFLYSEGLDGRSWFKHVIFAPGLWTGYAGAVFPGLIEAIDAKDYGNAEKWVDVIAESIRRAEKSLR